MTTPQTQKLKFTFSPDMNTETKQEQQQKSIITFQYWT